MTPMARVLPDHLDDDAQADWHRRVVDRSLRTAVERSVDRGTHLVQAAVVVLDRSNGEDITVQEVADEAGQSLRTLYQYFESKDDLLLAVFEEAMRAYAAMVRGAVADLTDPVERLAGAMIAAMRMPEHSGTGVDRGLARLRLRLVESHPERVGRAQSALTSLVRELVEQAAAAHRIEVADEEGAAFMLLSLNAAFITAELLGNDTGVRRPDVAAVTSFCLRGLSAELDADRFESIEGQLRMPARRRSGDGVSPPATRARRPKQARKRPAKKAARG
jgi:AcrR family transcriptional regulator